MAASDSKACRICGLSLPLDNFHLNPQNKSGRSNHCRACHAKACKERYHRTKTLVGATQTCAHCGASFDRERPDANRQNYCSIACRLWSKVDKSGGPDACWPWTAKARSQNGTGYGMFVLAKGKYAQAHRLAWELTNGPIPDGLQGCHTCDNRICCNPSHLFLGTAQDNANDKVAKGRQRTVVTEQSRQRQREAWVRRKARQAGLILDANGV